MGVLQATCVTPQQTSSTATTATNNGLQTTGTTAAVVGGDPNACRAQCEMLCEHGVEVCSCVPSNPTQIQNSVCLPPNANTNEENAGSNLEISVFSLATVLFTVWRI